MKVMFKVKENKGPAVNLLCMAQQGCIAPLVDSWWRW